MSRESDSPDQDIEVSRIMRVYGTYGSRKRARVYDRSRPGNRAIRKERQTRIRRLLGDAGMGDLDGRRVLEVGCGHGHTLALMRDLGARAGDLVGIDLMPDRIEEARQEYPGIDFRVGNAAALGFPDASFDLVLCVTVLSSVLSPDMARRLAGEMSRVLKPGGAIVWYDLRLNNPRNRSVRGLSARAVRDLFPGFTSRFQSVTVLPPVARRLGAAAPTVYPLLAALPFLRSHLVGLLLKPAAAPP